MKNIPLWEWLPPFRWRLIASAEAADEIPQRLPRNAAVFVGSPASPKWIAFDCPCHRGHRIMLNLDGSRFPKWKLSSDSRLTLFPSIDVIYRGRRCHYFIQAGRVRWVADSGIVGGRPARPMR